MEAVLTGKHVVDHSKSLATSYELVNVADKYEPDLIIVDESHKLKNPATLRSRYILGDIQVKWRGLIERAPSLFLTGTPTPNGRPNELWPVVFRCAPEVVDYLKYFPFVRRFCEWYNDGNEIIVTGARNTEELYARLRGSGFMVRREMDDVLTDLPPLRYKMVVFPPNSYTRTVLNKETAFSVEEILAHGEPVGTSYPTIRKEMGLAKLPQVIDYIKEVLDNGVAKVVVFAHHVDVVHGLLHGLKSYNPTAVLGATPPKRRDKNIFAFQNDPTVRVFIGNEAAEEGITLTAAADIVEVEFEWVPGKEDQRPRRLRRIGQLRPVVVHQLVVQNSIDAKILGRATDKAGDINKIYRGR
jgi:SWI/SNF-related matrix-associated actin-dependent regulator 1 of chromatin subfamily A